MSLRSEDTPFEGGVFQAELKFPRDYPLNPPKVCALIPTPRSQSLSDALARIATDAVRSAPLPPQR